MRRVVDHEGITWECTTTTRLAASCAGSGGAPRPARAIVMCRAPRRREVRLALPMCWERSWPDFKIALAVKTELERQLWRDYLVERP